MVGYYQTESIPNRVTISVGGNIVNLETMNPVKTLVCSPDLTVFTTSTCATEALVNSAAEDKSYRCLLCQKNFEQKSVYQNHLRSHGKEGENPYRCNICSKTFAVPARLTRHYRTHTGEKPYQCEYCNKSFSVKENLSVHRRIHTKERPYKCAVCARAFEHSGKLHRHMRIHTGERPHECSVCKKTFIQSGQLVIHMRTHTGEKPYVCKACGKGFTCSKQLKVHTRTHTGEKPYTCDICGKSFGYNHVLKLHQVAHYGEKVYKCTLCHETFGSKKTMEMHIKTHSDSSTATGTITGIDVATATPRDSSPIKPVIEISQGGHGTATANLSNTTGNKEDVKTEEDCPESNAYASQRDFSYYLYPSREQYSQSVIPINTSEPLMTSSEVDETASTYSQASTIEATPLEPPHVFFYPDPVYTGFTLAAGVNLDVDCSSLLNLPGNDARRRVEAALEAVEEERQREYGVVKVDRDPLLTPPSSNPVSPVPSPDPLDLAISPRETLILPPRKRCKMILESMESERSSLMAAQRQNSVIQFARAS